MIFEPSKTIRQILEESLLDAFQSDVKKIGEYDVIFLNSELKEIDYWEFCWSGIFSLWYNDNYDCLIYNLNKLNKTLKIKEIKAYQENDENYKIIFYLDENIEKINLSYNGSYNFSKERIHIKRFDKAITIEEILKDDLLNRENKILKNKNGIRLAFFDTSMREFEWVFSYKEYCGAFNCYKNLLECITDHLQSVKALKVKKIKYKSANCIFIFLDEDIKIFDKELLRFPTITQSLKIPMSKSINITFDCGIRIKEENDIEEIKKELNKYIDNIVKEISLRDRKVSIKNIEIL